MGEIATWSAVKTKVGLGKDSNECPTKAELLALSPTGTGESYIGLEISNASSYGDNETIQLSDIHKVTYKYILALTNKTLNFTALGGAPTPAGFDLVTQKQKYLDGVAQSGVIPVSYNLSAHPDWIYSENGLKATENLNTQERYGSVTFTQAESGKSIDGTVSQAAASQRFEYTFSSKYPGINFNALGGVSSANNVLDITSTRQEYRNNHTYGNLVQISFTNTGLPSWLINTNESWSAQENKSLSSRSHSMTYTQNESGKKFTVTFNQAAGTQTYGDITINPTSGIADIPAAGGTSGVFTYSYSQPWGWNGKTNDGGTITSGATVNWSNAISGSNLGTTQKARTRLGSRTLTLSQNGKSASKSVDVYQAANQIVNVTQGAWVVSIYANPSTFTEKGGTSQISASARAPRTNHWSSGATNAASDATGTPTLSIPTAVTGFSLSGTTLTVSENSTPNQRSVVVRATIGNVYKDVTITQSAYVVTWNYTFTASPTTLNFDALGTAQGISITSYREKYINGSLVSGSREKVDFAPQSTEGAIGGTITNTSIKLQENTSTSTKTGKANYKQDGSGKIVSITCNQAAATVTQEWVLSLLSAFPTMSATGGNVSAKIQSGYHTLVNGKRTTWTNDYPSVQNNPGWVFLTSVYYNNDDTYSVEAQGMANTVASGRSGTIVVSNAKKSLPLTLAQAAASISWTYYFKVTPIFLNFSAAGEVKKVTVSSYRKQVINGQETSTQENVTWKVRGTTGFHTLDTRIAADPNTLNTARTGRATYTQEGSGKTAQVNLAQAAPKINTFTLKLSASGMSLVTLYVFRITPQTVNAPNPPSTYPTHFFSGTGTQAQFQWNNNQGLKVLDPDTGQVVFAHAGDSLNIAVKAVTADSWANFMVIVLADGDQTIQAPI